MEKEIQVDLVSGETITVVVKSIPCSAMRRLKRLVMPAKVNPNDPMNYTVDYEKIEQYQDGLVKDSIVSPPSLKLSLDQVDSPSYDKLVKTAEEVNRLTETEKKNL